MIKEKLDRLSTYFSEWRYAQILTLKELFTRFNLSDDSKERLFWHDGSHSTLRINIWKSATYSQRSFSCTQFNLPRMEN